MDYREKIINYRQENNWSQRQFAERIGVSKGLISAIEQGSRSITPEMCARIDKLLDNKHLAEEIKEDIDLVVKLRLKMHWSQQDLATELGVSKSLISSIEQGVRALSFKLRHQIQELLHDATQGVITSDTQPASEITPVPFYSAKASAGYGKDLPEYEEKEVIYFDKRWLRNIIGVEPSNASLVQAEGDSMDSGNGLTSDIKDGDLLLVDNSITYPINNQKFVVRLEDSKLVVKKIKVELDGSVMLISNNPKYEPFKVPKADIIGKVMWNGSITV